MQLTLSFLDRPRAERQVWEQVSDRDRAVLIELLARILVKAIVAPHAQEAANE